MYECFHCGNQSVIWDGDFDFEDYGLDGDGIVHHCHCTECGAEIDYYIRLDDPEDNDPTKKDDGVKHGRWLDVDGGCMTICSECYSLGCGSAYCPNCGAKMDEVEE